MEMIESKEPCTDCGNKFMRIKQRGRPPVRCDDCRILYVQQQVIQNPVDVNEDRLYKGPKAELKGNRGHKPEGAEAQCIRCNRTFTSDSACEAHKDYRTEKVCIDPASLGMVAIERRGHPIWTRPSNRFEVK